MIQRHNALRSLSPWLLAIYFIASSWVGILLLSVLLGERGHSFHTLIMMISLIISAFLHKGLDTVGHWIGGKLSGLRVLMKRSGTHDRVLENGKMFSRRRSLETDIFPVIMCPKAGHTGVFGLYMLGGPLMNLLVSMASFGILYMGWVEMNSIAGTFLMAMILSGLWTFSFSAFPAYVGYSPNDGLNYLIFCKDKTAKEAFFEDLTILEVLSDPTCMDDDHKIHVPNLDLDDDISVMSSFRTAYLLRSYDLQMWSGHTKMAEEILSVLYYHLDDYPDEWQITVMQEAVYMLCLLGSSVEMELSDRLITPARRRVYERSMTPEALKALTIWSLHHVEMKKETSGYYQSFENKIKEIPYEMARRSWTKLIHALPKGSAIE